MSDKFTKGPWFTEHLYFNDGPENAKVVVMAAAKDPDKYTGTKVAEAAYSDIANSFYVDSREEAEANARLLAAAPDLLAALREMLLQFGVRGGNGASAQARAAIAKATEPQQ